MHVACRTHVFERVHTQQAYAAFLNYSNLCIFQRLGMSTILRAARGKSFDSVTTWRLDEMRIIRVNALSISGSVAAASVHSRKYKWQSKIDEWSCRPLNQLLHRYHYCTSPWADTLPHTLWFTITSSLLPFGQSIHPNKGIQQIVWAF